MLLKGNFFYLLLLLLLLAFVNAVGFNGLYGQDAYEYFRYTKALHNYFITGENPGMFFWSYMYPFFGSLLSFAFSSEVSLQLVSMLSFVFIFYFTEKILFNYYPDKRNTIRLYLFLFLFLSPFSLRCAVTCMSDTLCLCFIMGTFYFLLKLSTGSVNSFFYFICLTCAACATRYASAIILLLPVAYAFTLFSKKFSFRVCLLSVSAAVVILVPVYLLKNGSLQSMAPHYFIFGWDFANFFRTKFLTADGFQAYTLPNSIYCFSNLFSPGYFLIGSVLLFLIRKSFFNQTFLKIILFSWVAYSFFIGGIPFQNNRVLLLSFPLVIIFLFPAANFLWIYVSEKLTNKKAILIAVAIFQIALFARAFIPFYTYNNTEQKIINYIRQVPHTTIYTTELTPALSAFEVHHSIVDLWKKPLNKIEKPGLLLVNLKKFEVQYQKMNVMNNYNYIVANSQRILLKSFDGGWDLYEIR